MSRSHVICLALLGAVLLLDGGGVSQPGIPAAAGSGPASGLDAERPVLDALGVARIVANSNPELSPEELSRIGEAVVRYGDKYRLDRELVTAVLLVESGGRPWARSPKGAMGLMQVMPYMKERLGLVGNHSTIESNIEAGCMILAENIDRWGEERGILAYFWGGDIRGDAYLHRVQAARARVRQQLDS